MTSSWTYVDDRIASRQASLSLWGWASVPSPGLSALKSLQPRKLLSVLGKWEPDVTLQGTLFLNSLGNATVKIDLKTPFYPVSNPEVPPCSVWQLWPFSRWTHLASQPYLSVPTPHPHICSCQLLSGRLVCSSFLPLALSLSEVLSPIKSANTNPADQRIVNPKVTSGSNDVPET